MNLPFSSVGHLASITGPPFFGYRGHELSTVMNEWNDGMNSSFHHNYEGERCIFFDTCKELER